ncbi:MAG: ABC transporter permease [Clostridiales bacterium]|nr:ABC transporter permease [Clostridiales bacterium]
MKETTFMTKMKKIPPVAYMLIILVVVFSILSPNYLTFSNLRNILIQVTPLMIVAFGQTCIVLTQGTDLSLGAQVSFATVFAVWLATKGLPIQAGILLAMVATTVIGMVNGIVVACGNVPPFIATYGMQNIVNSISLMLTAGASIYFASDFYRVIAEVNIIGLPIMIWIAVLTFILVWLVLNKTKFGICIHGIGGNREALELAGINVKLVHIRTYAFAGLVAGIAGAVALCRVESGQPTVGSGWEFQAVAATLLGGSSLREGKGNVTGTIFGVLLIQVIKNGLNVVGVASIMQNAIIGSIVLAAIIIDALVRALADK